MDTRNHILSLTLSFLTSQPHLTLQTTSLSLTHSLPLVFMPLSSLGFLWVSLSSQCQLMFLPLPSASLLFFVGVPGPFSHFTYSSAALLFFFFPHDFDHHLCPGLKSLYLGLISTCLQGLSTDTSVQLNNLELNSPAFPSTQPKTSKPFLWHTTQFTHHTLFSLFKQLPVFSL